VIDHVSVEGKVSRTRTVLEEEAVVWRLKYFVIAPRHILIGRVGVENVFVLLTIVVGVVNQAVLNKAVIPTTAAKSFANTMNAHVIEDQVSSISTLTIRHHIDADHSATSATAGGDTCGAKDFDIGEGDVVDGLGTSIACATVNAIAAGSRNRYLNSVWDSSIDSYISRRTGDIYIRKSNEIVVRSIPSLGRYGDSVGGLDSVERQNASGGADFISSECCRVVTAGNPDGVSTGQGREINLVHLIPGIRPVSSFVASSGSLADIVVCSKTTRCGGRKDND